WSSSASFNTHTHTHTKQERQAHMQMSECVCVWGVCGRAERMTCQHTHLLRGLLSELSLSQGCQCVRVYKCVCVCVCLYKCVCVCVCVRVCVRTTVGMGEIHRLCVCV